MAHKDKKMTEEELAVIIDAAALSAINASDSQILSDAEKSMEFYLGEKYGNEQADHSQVVTREVMEAVEYAMPYLMKTFFGTSEAVKFQPQNTDDIADAEQATDYVNYVFNRQNRGFKIGYTWIKDALIQKLGVVKFFWDDDTKSSREEFSNLNDEELELILADENTELVSDVEEVDDDEQQISRTTVVKISTPGGQVRIEAIPPEEFLISSDGDNVNEASYSAHRSQKSLSDLRAAGLDISGIEHDLLTFNGQELETTPTYVVRHERDISGNHGRETTLNKALRKVHVLESYILVDFDNDGIAERRKVTTVGNHVLDNQPVKNPPFALFTPIMLSHKVHGLSYADLIKDLQLIQSTLFRNILDNMYTMNNGRYKALEGQVNFDDLLTSRANGVVRVKNMNALDRLDTPELSANAFNLLGYIEKIAATRTGNSERSRGTDGNQLNPNVSTSNMNQVMTAADQRIELVARVFAETGFKDLMLGIYDLVVDNEQQTQFVKLRGQFVEIDPSTWEARQDMTAEVGLGNNNKDQDMFHLNSLATIQQTIVSGGGLGTIVTPANVFNLATEFVKTTGRKDAERFFTDPGEVRGDEPPEPTVAERIKIAEAEAKIQQQQAEMALKQKAQELETQKLQLEISELEFKVRQHEDDNEFKLAELALEASQERPAKIGND